VVRGLLYAAIVPPWQAPDETGHFEHAWLVARLGSVPTTDDLCPGFEEALLGSLYEWRYGEFVGRALPEEAPTRLVNLPQSVLASRSRTVGSRVSLAYFWIALLISPFGGQDILLQLYAARLSTIILQLGIVWLAWRIFNSVAPGRPRLAAAMTAFVVFLPQHTFVNSTVGEGALAELGACLAIYAWIRLLLGPPRLRYAAAALAGTLVGMWAKKTAAFLLVVDVVGVGWLLCARSRTAGWRRRAAYAGVGLVAVALVLAVALGTPAGRSALRVLSTWLVSPELSVESAHMSLGTVIWNALDSFWARFGWMNVPAGQGWYAVVYVLMALAAEGWLLPRSETLSGTRRAAILLALPLVAAVATWVGFLLLWRTGLAFSQGRYLFPVTVPLAYFLVEGWRRCTPRRHQHVFTPAVFGLLAVLDAAAICLAIWPFYYGS
jgi:hypothetical protein